MYEVETFHGDKLVLYHACHVLLDICSNLYLLVIMTASVQIVTYMTSIPCYSWVISGICKCSFCGVDFGLNMYYFFCFGHFYAHCQQFLTIGVDTPMVRNQAKTNIAKKKYLQIPVVRLLVVVLCMIPTLNLALMAFLI